MSKDEIEKRKERVEQIRKNYLGFVSSVDVPLGVQFIAFDIPYRNIEAQDLCGIVFPEKDYVKLDERLKMFNLNTVDNPTQYIGVYWNFQHPLAVLELGLTHLDKSPIKILYDNGQYVFTKKAMLSRARSMLCLDAGLEFTASVGPLIDVVSDAKKLIKHKLDKEQAQQ
jgi:hypothetical protein